MSFGLCQTRIHIKVLASAYTHTHAHTLTHTHTHVHTHTHTQTHTHILIHRMNIHKAEKMDCKKAFLGNCFDVKREKTQENDKMVTSSIEKKVPSIKAVFSLTSKTTHNPHGACHVCPHTQKREEGTKEKKSIQTHSIPFHSTTTLAVMYTGE